MGIIQYREFLQRLDNLIWNELEHKPSVTFRCRDLAKLLGLNTRTIAQYLRYAISQGHISYRIQIVARRPARKYKFSLWT